MTRTQANAVWALCCQGGLPLSAEDAKRCWEEGRTYHLNEPVRLQREVEHLIDQANWEVGRTFSQAVAA